MGCHILANEDSACLYDSVTETAFGRVFHGDGEEKLAAFLAWYAAYGACRDPRVDPNIGDAQDEWLAKLDAGCDCCGAQPWETCDPDEDEHVRTSMGPQKELFPGRSATRRLFGDP